jgi:hypothetical protein
VSTQRACVARSTQVKKEKKDTNDDERIRVRKEENVSQESKFAHRRSCIYIYIYKERISISILDVCFSFCVCVMKVH